MISDQTLLVGLLAGSAVAIAGSALAAMLRGLKARTLEQRVASLTRPFDVAGAERDATPAGTARRLLPWIGGIVREHARFCAERDIVALETIIASAGFRPRLILRVLLGIKILLTVAIPSAALLYAGASDFPASQTWLLTAIALLFGLLGPTWIITLARRRYTATLRQGVPDALDLLTVCGDAGMELDGALEHVSRVIAHTNPATATLLRKLLDDMRVLPDRHDAFRHFAEQTGIESARRISLTVTISGRYGTPLNPALRALATDLRHDRMAALEAKAARLPMLLILPLLLFIVPALAVILTCPATQRLFTILPHPWAG